MIFARDGISREQVRIYAFYASHIWLRHAVLQRKATPALQYGISQKQQQVGAFGADLLYISKLGGNFEVTS